MKHEPDVGVDPVGSCVDGVSENRTPHVASMDPDLVGASGDRVDGEKRVSVKTPDNAVFGRGGFSALRHRGESFPIAGIASDAG